MPSREEQVRTEAELAKRLAAAPRDDRQRLYGEVYDRIYEMHLGREPDRLEFGASRALLPILLKLTRPGDRVLEVGCGAGLLAIELARAGRRVTGLEVSEVILERARRRAEGVDGIELRHVEGIELPYPDASFDFAYSVEMLEHLHEQDAVDHLAEAGRVLRPGGRYWLMTPSALDSIGANERFGTDVDVDADTHLKEWTYGELRGVLRRAGFGRLTVPVREHRVLWFPRMPLGLWAAVERVPRAVLRPGLIRLLGVGRCSVVAERTA
jgi:ubiquinone/menaquinone biosynthesis C-methylase UbiE